ncbi:MAG: twin-arginine translocase subunit TatC [Candidatus Omnitrophota bacterium]
MSEHSPNKMSVVQHLDELRGRLIASLLFFLACSILSFFFVDELAYLLKLPARGAIKDFIFLSPTEGFVSYVRISLLSGFICAVPFMLVQMGYFFMPALPFNRRAPVFIWLGSSFSLFIMGAAFAYFVALPFAIKFLVDFAKGAAVPMISIGKYFSFATAFLLTGAAIFQIPVIMGFLSSMGVLSAAFLSRNRRYAVVCIFIVSAVITPTQDVMNMLIFALPMMGLYEVGVLVSRLTEKRRRRDE